MYVAYCHGNGGVILRLKEDVNLDLEFLVPEWAVMEAMLNSWLANAIAYELWLGIYGNLNMSIFGDLHSGFTLKLMD